MRNEQVCSLYNSQQVRVALPDRAKDDLFGEKLDSLPGIEEAVDQLWILIFWLGEIWPDRCELQTGILDLLAVVVHRGDHWLMTTRLEFESKRHVRVQISKGAERA